jgi:hypothetical protein
MDGRLRDVARRAPPVRLVLLGLLLAINVGLVWWLPVLPGQDLPQHLAYTRIMLDHGRTELPFSRVYELPASPQPYFTTYHLLLALARMTSVDTAARLLFSGYVVLVFVSFWALVGAIHRRNEPAPAAWTPLLATLVVWSPSACMGFLAFVLAVPLVLLACATVVHAARARAVVLHGVALSLLSALLVSVHPLAAGCSLLFLAVFAGVTRQRRIIALSAGACAVMLAVHLAWTEVAGQGPGDLGRLGIDLLRLALDFESSSRRLGLTWSDLPSKLRYLSFTVLGPYRLTDLLVRSGLLALAVCLTALGVRQRARLRIDSPPAGPPATPVHGYLKAALVFLGASMLAPWGLKVPSDIALVNLRLQTVAFALLLACLPPIWFSYRPARLGLLLVALSCPLQFGYRAAGFGREAQVVTALLAKARPAGPMLPLAFHQESDHFAPLFRLTRFLPMYYTVWHGGISGQFWARYTPHLPVGYRAGATPFAPPFWDPGSFHAGHLRDFDHVLVEAARASDPEKDRRGFERARSILAAQVDRPLCSGPWCLYRLRHR